MPCCGHKREQIRGINPIPQALKRGSRASVEPQVTRRFSVCFEYVGRTGLTVIGPISGKHYRFERPGARLVVDPRDQLSLAAVPKLRQV
jgi:hypothetical protein